MPPPKAALCFIISYDHELNKEHLWREWIEPIKNYVNIYFFYKDYTKITNPFILQHAIPQQFICETTYTNNIGAYIGLMLYATRHDPNNQWFCFLTESCCPIASPLYFLKMFLENCTKSVLRWGPAWWNPNFHKRANLALLPNYLRLANDPYFILCRSDVECFLSIFQLKPDFMQTICQGGIANESIFAITLNIGRTLERVISEATHVTDWSRMTSATSPHVFVEHGDLKQDKLFLDKQLSERKFKFFVRKVSPNYPDHILEHYIYYKYEDSNQKTVGFVREWIYEICVIFFILLILLHASNGSLHFFLI